MSADSTKADLGAEREIDLRGWFAAARAFWWIAAAGVVVGVALGSMYSLSGGSTYNASVLLARGQAFAPGGTTSVLSFRSNPVAIQAYATDPSTIATVSNRFGIPAGELRGHITTTPVGDFGTATAANPNSVVLVRITVSLSKPKKAEDAVNAIAAIVAKLTSTEYVRQSLEIFKGRLANYNARLGTLRERIASLNSVLSTSSGLAPLDRLVIVSQLDQTEATLGQTLDSYATTQQSYLLARDVEQTQIIQPSTHADKSIARSRRNSVLFGGLIGLLLGGIAATMVGLRRRPQAA